MTSAEDYNPDPDALVPTLPDPPVPAFRLAVALGDPERERELLPALGEGGTLAIVERCLSADQLLGILPSGRVDLALVADDLHRLSDNILAALSRTRVPLVVLAARPEDARWSARSVTVLPLDASPTIVRETLLAAWRGDRGERTQAEAALDVGKSDRHDSIEPARTGIATIALASGRGSPGRSLVALNLAASLGAVAPTILVDLDVDGPSVAAYLDLDPTRNLFMLAHGDPRTSRDWERGILQEVQPLDPRSPQGVALCGVPKPEMRAGISATFVESLLVELRRRYRYVVLDVGADLLGQETIAHRLAIGASDQVLFVVSSDLIGLWHARFGLRILDRALDLPTDRVALVINRHQQRYHHRRSEIEWALDRPVAAVLPEDRSHVQRAIVAQRPVVLDRRSPVGRQLLDLATRLHGGTIHLPPDAVRNRRSGLLASLGIPRLRSPFPRRREVTNGRFDDHDVVATL